MLNARSPNLSRERGTTMSLFVADRSALWDARSDTGYSMLFPLSALRAESYLQHWVWVAWCCVFFLFSRPSACSWWWGCHMMPPLESIFCCICCLSKSQIHDIFDVGNPLFMPPSLIGGHIKRCFCLMSVRCLTSVMYIGPKSRTERPMKTKIAQGCPRLTWLGHHFQGQRSRSPGCFTQRGLNA